MAAKAPSAARERKLRELQKRADTTTDDAERERLLLDGEDIERGTPAPRPAPTPTSSGGVSLPTGGASAAAVILGFFAWVWLILPAISNDPKTGRPAGIAGSKAVLSAKFFNARPDGSPL